MWVVGFKLFAAFGGRLSYRVYRGSARFVPALHLGKDEAALTRAYVQALAQVEVHVLTAQVVLKHWLQFPVEIPEFDELLTLPRVLLESDVALDFVEDDDSGMVYIRPQLAQGARREVLDVGISVFDSE